MPGRNERRKRAMSPDDYRIWKISKDLRHGQNTLDKIQENALDDDLEITKECNVVHVKVNPQTIKRYIFEIQKKPWTPCGKL